MKAIKELALMVCLVLGLSCCLQSQCIDGSFDEWEEVAASITDPSGDNGSDGIDFTEIKVMHDENYIYLFFDTGEEINLQDNNNIKMSLFFGTDSQAGFKYRIVYEFGKRFGTISTQFNDYIIGHEDIGLVTGPTVTGTAFELIVNKNIDIGSEDVVLEEDPRIKIETSFGDIIPNNSSDQSFTLGEMITQDYEVDFTKAEGTDFRLLSYNVLFDSFFNFNLFEHYAVILSGIKPDVIAFQEIYSHTAQEAADLVNTMLGTDEYEGVLMGDDNIVVSKYPITASVALQGNGGFLLDIGGEEIALFNVHFPCCDNNFDRQREVDILMAFIRDSRDGLTTFDLSYDTPVIICGDMNLVGDKRQLATLLTGNIVNNGAFGPDFSPDVDNKPFVSSMAKTTGHPSIMTWYAEGSDFSPGKLDYVIFNESQLTSLNAYTLFSENIDVDDFPVPWLAYDATTRASDHLPMVVDFKFKTSVSNDNVADLNSGFTIAPNPAFGNTTISWDQTSYESYKLSVLDLASGKTLINEKGSATSGKNQIETNFDLISGVYIVRLFVEGKEHIQKLTITN